MNPLATIILAVLNIYWWIIIAAVIVSWLVGFNVINSHNQYVRQARYALMRLTEPVFAPIRRVLPDLGAIDASPLVALFGIWVLQVLVVWLDNSYI